MSLLKSIERLQRLDYFIKKEATGSWIVKLLRVVQMGISATKYHSEFLENN
jgi:hypothetical protein